MDLMPSHEHDEIAATVRSFIANRMPVAGRGPQHVIDGPEIDPGVWRECADMGWLSLGLPESLGGVGYGLVEEMMLFRELGRGLAPGPFLPGILGARVAGFGGHSALAGELVAGHKRVALGIPVGADGLSVVHSAGADLVLVCEPNRATLFAADECAIESIDPVDGTVPVGRGIRPAGSGIASVDAADDPVFDRGLVLSAAASVGIAEALVELAADHARERQQFGKPIGAFQGIKHLCADMAVRADGGFAQVCYAAVSVQDQLEGAGFEAAVAKYYADEATRLNGEGCVQTFGALGFTSEAKPYRYVLRGHVLARCLMSRAGLLDRIIAR
jgi:alkylation response protein AidB-like acyl-CoA dehydrogenase